MIPLKPGMAAAKIRQQRLAYVREHSDYARKQRRRRMATAYLMFRAMADADGVVRDQNGVKIAPGSVIGLTREWQRRQAEKDGK